MAKKSTSSTAPKTSVVKANASEVITTPVRNTAIPPKAAAVVAAAPASARKAAPSYEEVALRAYFIWKSTGGTAYDNWIRAERELGI